MENFDIPTFREDHKRHSQITLRIKKIEKLTAEINKCKAEIQFLEDPDIEFDFDTGIASLDINPEIKKWLIYGGISTLGILLNTPVEELLKIPRIGPKTISDLKIWLSKYELSLFD